MRLRVCVCQKQSRCVARVWNCGTRDAAQQVAQRRGPRGEGGARGRGGRGLPARAQAEEAAQDDRAVRGAAGRAGGAAGRGRCASRGRRCADPRALSRRRAAPRAPRLRLGHSPTPSVQQQQWRQSLAHRPTSHRVLFVPRPRARQQPQQPRPPCARPALHNRPHLCLIILLIVFPAAASSCAATECSEAHCCVLCACCACGPRVHVPPARVGRRRPRCRARGPRCAVPAVPCRCRVGCCAPRAAPPAPGRQQQCRGVRAPRRAPAQAHVVAPAGHGHDARAEPAPGHLFNIICLQWLCRAPQQSRQPQPQKQAREKELLWFAFSARARECAVVAEGQRPRFT